MTNDAIDQLILAAIRGATRAPVWKFGVDIQAEFNITPEQGNDSITRLVESGRIKESDKGGWEVVE